MLQGVLGVYPFSVSEDMVATFKDLKRERSIKFAQHKVVFGVPRLQHTGRELDTCTLQIILHPIEPSFSVDASMMALRVLASLGQELPLVLGYSYFGFYVIEKVSTAHTIFHNGITWHGVVDLQLLEYN